MSDAKLVEVPLLAELEALRAQGAQRVDAVRFHYLDTLCRRMQEQQGAVRDVLLVKLQEALKDYGQRLNQPHRAFSSAVESATGTRHGGLRSLVDLNHYLKNRTPESVDNGLMQGSGDDSEMMSVRHFRQGWSRICAQEQVEHAARQGPKNAGPLNSHMLVLRSAKLMRNISPIYLEQFLSHIDTMLWLDGVNLKPAAAKVTTGRRTRQKKQVTGV